MRKLNLAAVLVFVFVNSYAVTKTWTGTSGSNWNSGSNWTPAGVPTAADDVIFNTSVTVDIDLSPITILSLHIINSSNVVFQTNTTRNIRPTSTSASNEGFLIEAGSTFTLDAINTGTNNSKIELFNGTGVTGSVLGTLNISCTGGASNGPSIDTYNSPTQYGILTVHSGGSIRILPDADNTSSSLTPVPTIVMENGSLYENLKNGGSFPTGTWGPTSLARCQSPGSNGATFNGTNYGNLEWNCPSQTQIASLSNSITFNNVNFISTNSSQANGEFRIKTGAATSTFVMTVNGNLIVGVDARIRIASSTVTSTYGGRLHLKQSISNFGTITTGGTAGTINEIEFNGSSSQTFSNTGTLSGSELDFIMNNVAGLQLLTPVVLPGITSNALQLTTGKIGTTLSNLLTMNAGSGYVASSPTSFIEGPMKKIGNTNFLFPIGVGSIFAPVGITNVSGETLTDEFTAEYKRINPQSIHGSTVVAGMDHVSSVEYWTLDRNAGAASKLVSLAINLESFCYDLDRTYVSRYNTTLSHWTNEGGVVVIIGPTLPPLESGAITSVSPVSTFGDFTLITDLTITANPLPLKLTEFTAEKVNSTHGLIKWTLAASCSPNAFFEVEKSLNGSNFAKITSVNGSATNRFYSFHDYALVRGLNYYRLKATDENGKITYSKVEMIINDRKGLLITSLSPNPVNDQFNLVINSARTSAVALVIFDIAGRPVRQWKETISEGSNNLIIYTEELPRGIYYLSASAGDSKTVVRFIRQ